MAARRVSGPSLTRSAAGQVRRVDLSWNALGDDGARGLSCHFARSFPDPIGILHITENEVRGHDSMALV
jgi:hypothetical protein